MNAVSSQNDAGAGLYALKIAVEVEGNNILTVLQSAEQTALKTEENKMSGAALTGIGQNIDIQA
ncbi:MAG: hypothetical protein AB1763_07970 [Campylobacterota bacterium]